MSLIRTVTESLRLDIGPECFRDVGSDLASPGGFFRPSVRAYGEHSNYQQSLNYSLLDSVLELNRQNQLTAHTRKRREATVTETLRLPVRALKRNRAEEESLGRPDRDQFTNHKSQIQHSQQHLDHEGGDIVARINIEDSLFKDRRYQAFMLKLGDPTLALGAFCEACIIAQEYYLNEETGGLVPIEKWEARGIRKELIESGLAEVVNTGFVKLRGSDEQFAWLRRAQKAGEASGEARKKKATQVEQPLTQVNSSEPLTLSLTPTLSPSSSSDSGSDISSGASCEASAGLPKPRRGKNPKVEDPNAALRRETWEAYRDAYAKRWEFDPDRNAAVNSQIKSLVEKVGQSAPDVVRFFVGHNEGLYLKACHPMALCLRDHVALKTQMLRGQAITTADVRRLEKVQQQQGLLDELKAGNL